jgi:hypothetical protein
MRRYHGDGGARASRNPLRRVVWRNPHARRQQHPHVEAAGRMPDEMQFTRLQAAVPDDVAAQAVRTPDDRSGRLRRTPHDARIDSAPLECPAQHAFHIPEIAHRAERGEAEESGDQENHACHDVFAPASKRSRCGRRVCRLVRRDYAPSRAVVS